ncbi:VWA domain-containing protein [Fredinandcohnia humi]
MSTLKKFIFLMLCIFVVSGCNPASDTTKGGDNNEQDNVGKEEPEKTDQTSDEAKNEMDLNSPELPQTLEEVIAYPVGKFASLETKVEDEDVQTELNSVPKLSEDATDEELTELLGYLYSLYKMDYQDPRAMLKESTIGSPDSSEGPANKAKSSYNVEIILDSSGSMANRMGSKTRMDLAKEAIKKFASSLPKEANISLRVYGHKGSNADKDKQLSCAANEIVYPMQPYNAAGLDQALSKFTSTGWTPLAQALIEAKNDLSKYAGENNQNVVYLVSDGIETCGGDPIAAAKSLKDSGVAPVVNIIGFDLNNADQKQLQDIAKAAGGTYTNVKNQDQLQNEFEKTIQDSLKWLEWLNKETSNALDKFNNQTLDILDVSYDWQRKNTQEIYLQTFSLVKLEADKKITNDQHNKILDMRDAYYKQQNQSVEELTDMLLNTTNEDLDTVLKKIDEIYEENVSH